MIRFRAGKLQRCGAGARWQLGQHQPRCGDAPVQASGGGADRPAPARRRARPRALRRRRGSRGGRWRRSRAPGRSRPCTPDAPRPAPERRAPPRAVGRRAPRAHDRHRRLVAQGQQRVASVPRRTAWSAGRAARRAEAGTSRSGGIRATTPRVAQRPALRRGAEARMRSCSRSCALPAAAVDQLVHRGAPAARAHGRRRPSMPGDPRREVRQQPERRRQGSQASTDMVHAASCSQPSRR